MASLIQPRRVPASHGARWIVSGMHAVLHSPIGWFSTQIAWFAFLMLCSMLPMAGPVAFSLSLPAFFAGMMIGCRTIEEGRSLRINHLFSGLKIQPKRLFQLGMVNIAGETLLTLILVLWGGQQVIALENLSMDGAANLEQLQAAIFSLTPLFVTLALIQIALLMMGWFAPALLVFTPLSTAEALTLSSRGCLINLPAFLLYTLIMGSLLFAVTLVAFALPLISGLLTLVIVAIIIASVYASYQDVFGATASSVSAP
ncbi:MAG: hypothetical protein G3H99_03095 [Ferrovum sp.]|nr:hypothetical protein [Ferrovum sp.]NDU86880.1 hypothetical protein [Ferrovum sp.]